MFKEYVVSRIDEAVKEYSTQFDKLMFMLKEQVNALLNVMYVVQISAVIQNYLYHLYATLQNIN